LGGKANAMALKENANSETTKLESTAKSLVDQAKDKTIGAVEEIKKVS
jgi:F0F1-type ATP synthase membrane subunit b/b'